MWRNSPTGTTSEFLHTIWETGNVPQDFKDVTIIPLFKGKGSRQNVSNYRGISLLSVAGKILSRILLNRLNAEIMIVHTPEEQCGFRNGRSTVDLIFASHQLHEKCQEKTTILRSLRRFHKGLRLSQPCGTLDYSG